ncbi:MAG: methyltransferase domain-containing protein, partial [Actinomycetota bacterium]|nr:methyltransferase domain-containing protein [Actinomycetota bacterium]
APFFAKRVHGIDVSTFGHDLQSAVENTPHSFKRTVGIRVQKYLRRFASARRALEHRSSMKVPLQVCQDCTFVGPRRAYRAEELLPLYEDYRSATYNADRSAYEPNYSVIQDLVGKSAGEVQSRLDNIASLLADVLDPTSVRTVIDWGGGDGRFVPLALRKSRVLIVEVSDEPLVDPSFVRLAMAPDGTKAEYIQVCHLLEHVSSPRALLAQVLRHASDEAIIYLEVPLDRSTEEIVRFQEQDGSVRHGIHEHLNLFSIESLRRLGTSQGLSELDVREVVLDLGWTQLTVLCGLFRFPGATGAGPSPRT